ncbi:cupin domain-containing protein [Arthrobacter sp. UYEF3]|uniref:cupin domain-containing protein n=1 Tax=Arthrobacter sp. UYEF3 TaxID=1756365 RepID=UPI0033962C0D
MSLARTLTHAEHGSSIMAGVSWMKPGEVSTWWSTEEERPDDESIHYLGPVHEFFYLMRGECTIEWADRHLDFVAEDTAFFAPGWRYRISNTGVEDAVMVYAVTPPLG